MEPGDWLVVDVTGREDYPEEALAHIEGLPVSIEARRCSTPEEIIQRCRDADALLITGLPVGRELLEALPKLRAIVRYGVGLDNIDLGAARELGVDVRNTRDYCSDEVADHVVALLLALERRICEFAADTRAGGWLAGRDRPMRRLRGLRAGIIGLGEIGSSVARRLQAFGLEVVAYDPYLEPERAAALGVELLPLNQLLETSHVVSINCPLTDETRGMIAHAELARMRDDAVVITTARGAIIDEAALIAALRAGEIAAAGLDVLSEEPPDPDNPLLAMPNVIVTPHVGWASKQAAHDVVVGAFALLADALSSPEA